MSFEAVWGFDPEKAMEAQEMFQRALVQRSEWSGNERSWDIDSENVGIPKSPESQVDELRRMFRR